MAHDDPGWLIMAQYDIPGVRGAPVGPGGRQGAPGGSRLLPTPKWVIKQQNNGSKPWLKVPKVCPDPKGMVSIHFWCIWGHLGAVKQCYIVKTQYCKKSGLSTNFIQSLPHTTGCNFLNFLQFSRDPEIPRLSGKLPQKKTNPLVKFGCGSDCIKVYFFQKMIIINVS